MQQISFEFDIKEVGLYNSLKNDSFAIQLTVNAANDYKVIETAYINSNFTLNETSEKHTSETNYQKSNVKYSFKDN